MGLFSRKPKAVKRLPKRKKFDGKWYERVGHGAGSRNTKRQDEIWADGRRKEGHSVRIVETSYGHEVYIRRK